VMRELASRVMAGSERWVSKISAVSGQMVDDGGAEAGFAVAFCAGALVLLMAFWGISACAAMTRSPQTPPDGSLHSKERDHEPPFLCAFWRGDRTGVLVGGGGELRSEPAG